MNTPSIQDTPEIYTNGYDQPTLDFMRRRTLATHGRFVTPLLKKGLNILDLGCGPGTMTLEIAAQVGPEGSVMGIDRHEAQFTDALSRIGKLPVTFRAMDAYHLELEDHSYDGIFSHALFEHLTHPIDVLLEAKRVLKDGGFIALRSPDWGGLVVHPSDKKVKSALAARLELQTRNGGNVYAGRHLKSWLTLAGFTSVTITGEYEIYPDNHLIVEHLASQLERDGQSHHAMTWRKWGENPDAIFAQAWFAATAYKKGTS